MAIDLKLGIVRVLQSDGKTTSGAGFVVSEKGLLATCSHVIQPEVSQSRGEPKPEKVYLIFCATGDRMSARVLPEFWRPADKEDLAVLQLEGDLPAVVRPLPLGSSESISNHAFQTFGFPDSGPDEGTYGDGHILNELQMHGTRVLQVSSPQVTPGFSGGPVLDMSTSRIVGMVTAIAAPDKYGRMSETAFITPTETLREICPLLELSDIQPYLGLAAFTEKDAEFFFGRKKTVEALAEALKSRPRFLLVMGPSGSGKSSVVQAGLIPSLRKGAVPGSDRWGIMVARPADRPFESLEAKGLEGASKGLADAASLWLKKQAGMDRMLLILDQFEEFLVTCPSILRQQFWTGLEDLLDSDIPVTVMAVMRDDFYSRFAQEAPSQLLEWIKRGVFPVSASLEPEDLKEIIEQPAHQVGLALEEGLAQVIINDVLESSREDGGGRAGRSTVLPLLEFALTQVWQRREQGFLTHQAYNAVGKVTGSLTAWADEVCRSLEKESLAKLTRRIFTDLVNLGDEAQRLPDSRRRRLLEDLCNQQEEREPVHRIVQRLADARLVTTSTDKGEVIVEIIHDSLIREWSRLQRWLKKDRNFLAWKRELEKDAEDWKHTSQKDVNRRDESRLLRGQRLGEAERWLTERKNDLNETEIEFIQASVSWREQEREKEEKDNAEKERTRRWINHGLVVFSIVVLILAGFAYIQMQQANEKSRESLALYMASQSEQIRSTSGSNFIGCVCLAIESLRKSYTFAGDEAMRHALEILPKPVACLIHNGSVSSVAFSPDGKIIVTASDDFNARIWDVKTRDELFNIHHDGMVHCVAFSSDGSKIATASSDGTARIVDAETGKELFRLNHLTNVNLVTFSPDGKRVATASDDFKARIWDVKTGKEILSLNLDDLYGSSNPRIKLKRASNLEKYIWGRWDGINASNLIFVDYDNSSEMMASIDDLAFSPDGKLLATASNDFIARIWDVQTGKELFHLNHDGDVAYDHGVTAVDFSPNGKWLATASNDGIARIWDIKTGKELLRLRHNDIIMDVAFSPDNKRVATTSNDGTARIWDAETGNELVRLRFNFVSHKKGSIYESNLAFSPDGGMLATANSENTVGVWDVKTGEELFCLSNNGLIKSVAFSPDGKMIASASSDNTCRIFDIQKEEQSSPVCAISFGQDCSWITARIDGNTSVIRNVWAGKDLLRLNYNPENNIISFSPNGKRVAISNMVDVSIWNIENGKELLHLAATNNISYGEFVGFSFDGNMIAAYCTRHNKSYTTQDVEIWNTEKGKRVFDLKLPTLNPIGPWRQIIALSPDGKKAATAFGVLNSPKSDNLSIWDVETGKELVQLIFPGPVFNVAFSPDDTRIAVSCGSIAMILDASTWKIVSQLNHDALINHIAFSPDGNRVATASDDGSARIWNAETGVEIFRLEHANRVYDVVFSPDGTHVSTLAVNFTSKIWSLSSDDLICEACSRLTYNLTTMEWMKEYCGSCLGSTIK